jgi:hypothetical protein
MDGMGFLFLAGLNCHEGVDVNVAVLSVRSPLP